MTTRIPASLALLLLRQSGITVSPATLRSWVHRGHLTRAEGGYCVREIREYVEARNERACSPPESRSCGVEDCTSRSVARGYCMKHYRRLTRHGDLNASRFSDDVGYDGVHTRLRNTHGRADTHTCVTCSARAVDWAYDHGDPAEVVDERGRVFSRDPRHYQPMCRPCHRRLDRGHAAA